MFDVLSEERTACQSNRLRHKTLSLNEEPPSCAKGNVILFMTDKCSPQEMCFFIITAIAQ